MTNHLLNLEIAGPAQIAYSSLGTEDRRLVDAWFEHLRNWRNDDFIRTKSRRLRAEGEVYVFQTSTDLLIAFQIVTDKVIVLSIFREEALRKFETMVGRGSS